MDDSNGGVRMDTFLGNVTRALSALLGAVLLLGSDAAIPDAASALAPPTDPGRRLELALRHLDTSSRLLYVTAHPDDEDSGLLARLRFADGVRVRLLTLTRGEGGQNEIGTHLSDALGVLRSRELEQSATWLGNEQRFGPAFEFGYSFSVEETLAEWDEDLLVREIVREIRVFRPHVVLTMLLDGPGGGQHHQASARLTLRAFEVAATDAWPELGPPHTAARLYTQVWQDDGGAVDVDLDLGVYDPLLGATYEEYGLRARESHRCQGMAELHAPLTTARSRWRLAGTEGTALGERRPGTASAANFDGFPVRSGTPDQSREGTVPRAEASAFAAAIEATRMARERGSSDEVVAQLERAWISLAEPGRAQTLDAARGGDVDAAAGRRRDVEADVHAELEERRDRLTEALGAALGLTLHARADRRYVAAGDTLAVEIHAASAHPATLRFRPVGPRLAAGPAGFGPHGNDPAGRPADETGGSGRSSSPAHPVSDDAFAGAPSGPWSESLLLTPGVPARLELAIPLTRESAPTLPIPVPRRNRADAGEVSGEQTQAGRHAHPDWSSFAVEPLLRLAGGSEIPLRRLPVLHQERDPDQPRILLTDPQVVPDPSIRPLVERIALPLGLGPQGRNAAGSVPCTWVVSSLVGGTVEVEPILPPGWSTEPRNQRLELRPQTEVPVTFTLEAPAALLADATAAAGNGSEVVIEAEVRDLATGATSRTGYLPVEYEHVRPGALLVPARTVVTAFPCTVVPDLRIGYVEGSGDGTRAAIERLGYTVVPLDTATLLHGDLAAFDVIVTGVRAYKVREDLAAATPRIRGWMEAGGVLLVQYNKFEFNAEEASSPFAPFPGARVGTGRVTDQDSPVVPAQPEHPVFRRPNAIGPDDWDGWVQERGLYFLEAKAAPYASLLTLADPFPYNAGAHHGGLVEAEVGAGRWVYLGIGLFRQLPAAVPGAYRLLANLLALGSEEPTRP